MPTKRRPRFGSLAYYPRKRSRRTTARVRCWAKEKDAKLLGFAGYKVGMVHLMADDNNPNSITKGQTISMPATIIECPPLKTASVRFYKKTIDGLRAVSEVFAENLDKELERRIIMPKNKNKKIEDVKDFDDLMLIVYTQPKLTGIGKKKPELFEMAVGGKKEDKLNYAKNILGKEINISDVFKAGNHVDVHAISKGYGLQGPVRRLGIGLKGHKSEKGRRRPGSLGAWCGQVNLMWKAPFSGQTGYFQRTEFNKWLLKIGNKADDINPKSGFLCYGVIKNPYILLKGSVPGLEKRLIRFNFPIRPNKRIVQEAPVIRQIVQ